jgi:hypothetical protein
MVCATALGDLTESSVAVGRDLVLRILSSALLFGAALAAILYGVFLHAQIANSGSLDFQERLLSIAVWMSIVFLALATTVQILLGRIKEEA